MSWSSSPACSEPGCPPVETVIAMLDDDDGRRTWKLHRRPAAHPGR
ncbi:hypothetical protein [Actinocrinis sp.]|nr:hypothetical protein [Actinocrinis sp.]